jgi:hypothetical protein
MTVSNRSTPARDTDTPPVDDVRAVTDGEVRSFDEQGWVLLPGLVAPERCREMLERGMPRFDGLMSGDERSFPTQQARLEHMRAATASGEGTVVDNEKWLEWRGPVRSAADPAFSRVALAPAMGRAAQRLLGRDRPVRILHDLFACKLPDRISTPTGWHQDAPNFPLDRNVLTVWIALDEITPEQGPVRFRSGSHRRGLLGRNPPERDRDLLDEYPELERLPVSPAHHMQPGDCTVHHGLTLHGAGANETSRPRWSYFVSYFPGDARYSGAPNHDFDGFDLRVGQPVEHPSFALVPS